MATDNGVPARNSTIRVYVEILDYNDNSPVFENISYVFSVAENVSAGFEIHQMIATDADDGLNAKITFTMDMEGNTPNLTINETVSISNESHRKTVRYLININTDNVCTVGDEQL